MKRVVLPIVIMLGSILVAVILIRTPTQVQETAPEVIPVTVRTMEAHQETVQLVVESQGKVQAAQMAAVSASVAGPVAWISPAMEAGGYVKTGDVLLRLDTSDFQTALARSRASRQQAEADYSHASTELNRITDLAARRLVSDSQLQEVKRQTEVAAARLADAEANLKQAEMDLERSEIRAPFNAIVESRDVELGQYVNRAQSVGVLLGADVVEVRVPLAIRQLGYLDIELGQRGEIPADEAPEVILKGMYGGEEHQWRGKLVRIEASIDPNSNTVQTIIRVAQPETKAANAGESSWRQIPLPIGLFVEARIVGKHVDNLFALPRSVVRNNNQVLVVDAENKMYFREIEIYRLEEDRVLVSGGLLPGERICTSPIQAVVNGMTVQPLAELI
jgi:RND family efflux transporter MFP subunit